MPIDRPPGSPFSPADLRRASAPGRLEGQPPTSPPPPAPAAEAPEGSGAGRRPTPRGDEAARAASLPTPTAPARRSRRQHRSRLADLPPFAPLPSGPLDRLDWTALTGRGLRSVEGQYGVRFIRLAGRQVVTKAIPGTWAKGRYVEGAYLEAMATQLAHAIGLKTLEEMFIVADPPPELRRAAWARPGAPILVMNRVRGQAFSALSEETEADFLQATPRGEALAHQMGEVGAFDYLIGNDDRFPTHGLGLANNGNLMVTAAGDQVVCIDNTIGVTSRPPRDGATRAEFAEAYRHSLQRVFAALASRDPVALHRCFGNMSDFFEPESGIDWPRLQPAFVDGFAQGMQRVASLPAVHLEAIMRQKESTLATQTALFLRDNLTAFKAAVG